MSFNPYSDLIFIWGMPGAGKSTFGRRLAQRVNSAFTDLDVFIEHSTGKTIPQIFRDKGEDSFRQIEHDALIEVIRTKSGIVSTGGGTPCFFGQASVMKNEGLTIFLDTPLDLILKRISGRSGRPLLDDSEDKLRELRLLREKRLPFYQQAEISFKKEPADLMTQIDRFFL